MRRLLSTPATRYFYLQSFKKPVVEIPTSKPPKYIYQMEYHPSAMPNFEMGFKDHHHTNDWLTIYEGEEDKYEFQYSGQWWETTHVTTRLFIFILITSSYIMANTDAEKKLKKHLPGPLSSHSVAEVPASHIPTIIEN